MRTTIQILALGRHRLKVFALVALLVSLRRNPFRTFDLPLDYRRHHGRVRGAFGGCAGGNRTRTCARLHGTIRHVLWPDIPRSMAPRIIVAAASCVAPNAGKGQLTPCRPFATSPLQQMGAQLQVPRHFADRPATIKLPHRRNLQIAALYSPGQIHTPLHSMYSAP